MNLKDGIKRNCSGFMKEKEIIKDFISVNEDCNDITLGKYSSKEQNFYPSIRKWQMDRRVEIV